MQIVTISPKGQITIPVGERKKFKNYRKFLLETKGSTIILRPVEIKVVDDDLEGFGALADASFAFWDNDEDDVYQEFYS